MDAETALRIAMAGALGLDPESPVRITGRGALESAYPVAELATASVCAAALATADLRDAVGAPDAPPAVDRGLAGAWFGAALTPVGWTVPPPWDPIAGDYPTVDGWIRLHTNVPRHRAAALRVLGVAADHGAVADAVARWAGEELESEVVAEGGCAAVLRGPDAWAGHPQGAAVAGEALVASVPMGGGAAGSHWMPSPARPLAGLRVLDLTRVLAGPVATRLLAGLGADVLRIDPPEWDEPGVVPEMTVGKRTARLDARDPSGLAALRALLAGADVLVHGYRPDALEHLGLGEADRDALRPGLVEVSLDAYGWTGPWAGRRGFDSLVQMSTGIAGWGLRTGGADRPTPLPVQALDHATGYLMAAAVLRGLAGLVRHGSGVRSRLSLARTAVELERATDLPAAPSAEPAPVTADPIDTAWGAATLLGPPFSVGETLPRWERGPHPLGTDAPVWS